MKKTTTSKVSDLEKAREQERQEELRAEARAAKPKKVQGPTDAELLAMGCHPDSLHWDGADRGL